MPKLLLIAATLVIVLSLALTACSNQVTTTTSGASTTSTTETTTVSAASSTTTNTTQSVAVWQTVRYEQNTVGLVYSGSWTYSSAAAASHGGFTYTDSKGASVTFQFIGSYCGWLAKTSNLYGKAKVTVDGSSTTLVDLYSKDVVWRHIVWETKSLPFGNHTVKIEWTGKKSTGSKGTRINIDAIEIVGALIGRYQQNDAHFKYAGKWKTSKDGSASGGTFALTKSPHSSLTVRFTGIQMDWFAKEAPAYGRAQVTVDQGAPVIVDLYSADVLWGQTVWSSGRLKMGPHVVTISWTGTKDPASTDTYIDVDGFEIAGAVE